MSCSPLKVNRGFEETYCLNFQGRINLRRNQIDGNWHVEPTRTWSNWLCSPETSDDFQKIPRSYIAEDSTLVTMQCGSWAINVSVAPSAFIIHYTGTHVQIYTASRTTLTVVLTLTAARTWNLTSVHVAEGLNKYHDMQTGAAAYVTYQIAHRNTYKTNQLRGLSPQANYTDRATADCRRSWWQLLRIESVT
jgi:hypothetical protein